MPVGKKFVAYATLYIKGYILSALKGARSIVKRRSSVHTLSASVFRAQAELVQQYCREPTVWEIAEYLDADVDKVHEVLDTYRSNASLQDHVGKGETTELGDLIKDTTALDPAGFVEQKEMQETIQTALEQLSERERRLIELHFNLTGEGEHTLESLGKEWGMKRKEIRKLLGKALEKVRDHMSDTLDDEEW